MKSGLEDRNNQDVVETTEEADARSLNEVRPGRPEQSVHPYAYEQLHVLVSMKSGLEDRNNREDPGIHHTRD